VQLSGESYNAFNHANSGNPGSTFGAPAFGSISTAADAPVMLLGLKIYF
jgi:hypothetical protein